MADLTLQLSDEQLQEAITGAILKQLDDATRDAIITQAIKWLNERPENSYYGGRARVSRLEDAFNEAVRTLAHKMIREYIDSNPVVRAQLQQELDSMIGLALSRNKPDTWRAAVAEALANAFDQHGS